MAPSHLLTALGLGLAVFSGGALTAPSKSSNMKLDSPIPGYDVVELSFHLEVDPVHHPGEKTVFNGTIQQALDQALKMNPNYLSDWNLTADALAPYSDDKDDSENPPPPAVENAANILSSGPLSKSGGGLSKGAEVDHHICGDPWWPCSRWDIFNGISYLRGIPNLTPEQGPGPGTCGRVSCSYGAAIWWCNDKKIMQTLRSYGEIADGASFIANNCETWVSENPKHRTSGQAFMKGDWNVIVREDWSNGC